MFTLPLNDPLWRKLDDAHRNRDMAEAINKLSASWDAEDASSVFWDHLCHQDTCYGATYASVPHFLAIAEQNPSAHEDIAHFLAHVALAAFSPGGCCGDDDSIPQGIPLDLQAWDRKMDTFRSLANYARRDIADPPNLDMNFDDDTEAGISGLMESFAARLEEMGVEIPKAEKIEMPDPQADLERYEELLSRPPVDDADLALIGQIRQTFLDALPLIADLCGQAYLRSTADDRYDFLVGVAAGMKDRALAQLFEYVDEGGRLRCRKCRWGYIFLIFSDCLGLYAAPVPNEEYWERNVDSNDLKDWEDGNPSRADIVVRAGPDTVASPAAQRLRALISQSGDKRNLALLDLFQASFDCVKCGASVPVSAEIPAI